MQNIKNSALSFQKTHSLLRQNIVISDTDKYDGGVSDSSQKGSEQYADIQQSFNAIDLPDIQEKAIDTPTIAYDAAADEKTVSDEGKTEPVSNELSVQDNIVSVGEEYSQAEQSAVAKKTEEPMTVDTGAKPSLPDESAAADTKIVPDINA